MDCTVRIYNNKLVLDGGNKTDDCMTIHPNYFKDFDLKEGDIVYCTTQGLYNYINIKAKKVYLKNNREAWQEKDGSKSLIRISQDERNFWDNHNLYRNMENYIELLEFLYL